MSEQPNQSMMEMINVSRINGEEALSMQFEQSKFNLSTCQQLIILNDSFPQTRNQTYAGNWYNSTSVNIFIITFGCLLFLIGTLGNTAVSILLSRRRSRKTDTFLMSLALADMIACVIGPADSVITYSFRYTRWEFDQQSSEIIQLLIGATLAISSWTLAAISIDRYWAIVKPFESHRISDKMRVFACFGIWIIATAASYTFQFNEAIGIEGQAYTIYTGILVCIAWLMPVTLILIMYSICIKTLRRSKVRHVQNESIKKRNEENNRIMKMFIIITTAFFVTAIPAAVIAFLFPINDQSDAADFARHVSHLILYMGCSFNPFIYAKMHRGIRNSLVSLNAKLALCQCRKQIYSIEEVTEEIRLYSIVPRLGNDSRISIS